MRRDRWGAPGSIFLEAEGSVRVRFQEVDALRVVWHGHYLGYFEEGRHAFGRAHGFEYQDVHAAGYLVPIVHASADYAAAARFGDVVTVRTRLHPEAAARLSFTYLVRSADGRTLATGRTVQVFTDLDGRLVLTRPRFYEEFLTRFASSFREDSEG